MAYFVVPANDITQTTNSTALGVDVRSGAFGVFSKVYTSDAQARINLRNLLLTRIGERYMQPTFGTNLLNIIFEPNVSELKEDIDTIIRTPINRWLPYIDIQDINIVTNEDDPILIHNLKITINYAVQNYSTATITITADESGDVSIQ